jgi:hypothetical protein
MQPRRFYLNTANRSFIAAPDATAPSIGAAFFEEDNESIELYFLEPTTGTANYRFLDYSGNTVKLAVGVTAPAALQNSFSSISTAITTTRTMSVTGGSGVSSVQRVQLSPTPSTGSFALQIPSRNVTVSSISANVFSAPYHGLLDGQSVTLTAFTITSGFSNGQQVFIRDRTRDTFQIAATAGGTALTVSASGGTAQVPSFTTGSILANSSIETVQQAFVDAGLVVGEVSQAVVTGAVNDYLVTFTNQMAGVNVPLVNVVANTLAGAPGLSGSLNFNTTAVASIISAGLNNACVMEVEVTSGGNRQTYQQSASIANDIITSTSPAPLPVGPTTSSINFTDGSGGTWALSVDANGIVTTSRL